MFNIGLLHTCLSGRVGHEPYAPCSLDELLSKGYDYWALGHVHEREVLCESPWVVFSGNLQGRHLKETGPKGATLVEVTNGVVQTVTEHELCVVRFEDRRLAADGLDDPDDIVDAVASRVADTLREVDGKTLVLRMTVEGRTAAHNAFQLDPARWEAEIRARAAEHSDVWLSQIVFRTQPHIDIDRVRERRDAVGQVLRAVNEAARDPERLSELGHLFDDLSAKLPPEVRDGSEGLRLDDPEVLKETLRDVEQLLLVHLVTEAD
jgi:DNA repair exonuclease SbcCD nuclease subunit